MLFFLSQAARAGLVVDQYRDHPVGIMKNDAHGKMAMTRITLRPQITFSGTRTPDAAEVDGLHHAAHELCYIANSISAEVIIEKA
jgi:organic hydroperoxide reductase OsmC/OhrA